MSRTVVVGAGLGGLTVAHALLARGEDVRVLEAGERAGGVLHSERRKDYLLESGAHAFSDANPEFRALIDELGLAGEVVHADPAARKRYLVHRGHLEPLPSSPPQILATPLLSLAGKLRAFAEPLLARRGRGDDETLEEFGHRHLGNEATTRLLDAVQTGIFAGNIAELSARSTFPRLVDFERDARSLLIGMARAKKRGALPARGELASFNQGMGQLADALAQRLGDKLELENKVESIARGWRLQTTRGELEADRVVLAVHPRVAAQVVKGLDVPLADALEAIPHAPMAMVHLGMSRERVAHALDGFGFIAPPIENRHVLGCIFESSIFPNRAPAGKVLLTALVGGRRHAELVHLDDRALVLMVRDELRGLLGVNGEPELTHVTRHTLGIPQYTVGHAARLETIALRLRELSGLHLCGWGYRGVGALDVVQGARELASRLVA